jgi:hypothetical protein
VRDLVAVYKNPPYPVFYDAVYHSYALVPMLASPLYYRSKFSSTVLTSFITGVPIIADAAFMGAYTMIEHDAVYYQEIGSNELDVMFNVVRMPVEEMWRTRMALDGLRTRINARAASMIAGWLRERGVPVPGGSQGRRQRHLQRRSLMSPLLLLGASSRRLLGLGSG